MRTKWMVGLALLAALASASGCSNSGSSSRITSSIASNADDARKAPASEQHILVTEIACQPLTAMTGIAKAVNENNKDLAIMMMQYGLGSGKCQKFTAGTAVNVEHQTTDGFVEIRRPGDVKTFWIPPGFVGP